MNLSWITLHKICVMKTLNKWTILFTLLIFAAFPLYSVENSKVAYLEEEDVEALREWVKTKQQQVTVKKKGGNLSISGEIRTELQSTNEKKDGVKQRAAIRAWDVEVNLMLSYRADRTWGVIKLEFDNNAGTVGGTFSRLALERAFFGGRVVDGDLYTIDLEIGRRALGYTFDSKVQFGSFMDGILFKYDHAFETIGDLYFHGGPFLVDEARDHYAYVGEIGLLNIGKTGAYSKLSYIDWDTKHTDNHLVNNAFSFRNLQLTLGYKVSPSWLWGKLTTFYGAALVNTAAVETVVTNDKKENLAWYVGCSIGVLRKQWDWSFDINYQWVQAQAVPDFDGSGIGRGNAEGVGLYSTKKRGEGSALTSHTTVGAGNYKGISIEFLYNLTNTITVYQSWRQSVNYTKAIGPNFSYKQYEVEVIFAF